MKASPIIRHCSGSQRFLKRRKTVNSQAQSYLEEALAEFFSARSALTGEAREQLYDLLKRLVASLAEGHICLPLSEQERQLLAPVSLVADCNDIKEVQTAALVVYGGSLYFERYFNYERRLALRLAALADDGFDLAADEATLQSLFARELGENKEQEQAARDILHKALVVVSGGPGTGKTTTIVKMLVSLLASSKKDLKIGLAAPTGKAAARLAESVGTSLGSLELPDWIVARMPTEATTLHRLLGVRRYSSRFRHNRDNPVDFDVVVVDEASMVDLAMMSKLVDALKPGSRLVLLGDKNQLASVESGAVLADCIEGLPTNTIELLHVYRFDDTIRTLAAAINQGDMQAVWGQLNDQENGNLSVVCEENLLAYCCDRYDEYLRLAEENSVPDEICIHRLFAAFRRFQVLCALTSGGRGAIAINQRIEQGLDGKGRLCKPGDWYNGRPVLITRNDYNLGLYNGDIGICLWSHQGKGFEVWFEGPGGELHSHKTGLLPESETVYAMTIHKSQGSEFDEVVVVLPDEENRVLGRELLYTAVTRAKTAVKIAGSRPVLALALERRHQRQTGLKAMLEQMQYTQTASSKV
ncbi:MAG: exodeoxyribonuclease V subunit alpha [Deltaproteobacteria bacterium]|nr:MAG: exodeoxyribonuclease V subunit alpha [Deltaproteobacteria bacterium]